MKKLLSAILAVMMILTLFSTVNVFADASAIFTMSSASVLVGDTVSVQVSLKSSEEINSIALSGFTYNSEILTFTGFSDYEHIEDLTILPPTFDEDKMAIVIALKDATAFDGNICKMNFTVNKAGTATVSATPLTKKGSTVIESSVVDSTITATEKPKENFKGLSMVDATYTYDGTEKSVAVKGTIPAGASVVYENEKATDAGEYNVRATVSANGYNDLVLTSKLVINPKALTVTGLSAQAKTYDGTTDAILTGGTLNGVVSADDVTAVMPISGTFAKKDAGTGIAVSFDEIVLSGTDKGNYTLTQPTGLKATISKTTLKVKADDLSMTKGSDVPELTYTITEGKLFGDDALTGALTTKANGSKVGTFDITQGTLKATSNYTLTFIKGTLTVEDKTTQNITVSEITSAAYGDASITLTVTPDSTSQLANFTYESSNTDVAEISAEGVITIKAAGKADITVKQAGNDEYAPFTKKQTLVVTKKPITVNADAKNKKVGAADPELTYTVVGDLVAGDTFTGSLTRKAGETVGQYDILIGTLEINDNYDITYNKAIFEIVDKTVQNITVSAIASATYGDVPITLTVTPDSTANLTAYTFESSNTDVAEVSAEGVITIKAAGEADITVKQTGNDEYAAYENTQKLVVGTKGVTVTSVNLAEKTAVLEGVIAEDTAVAIDFDKLNIEIIEAVDETTSKVKVTNFALKGEKSENYTVITENVEGTIATENIVTLTITATNGTVTGAGSYIKGSTVAVVATPNSKYKFSGWYFNNTLVSQDANYTFKAECDIELHAKFTRESSGGGGGGGGGAAVKPPVKEEDKQEEPKEEKPSASVKFNDVKENDWYFDYVTELAEKGIVSGNGNGGFAPNANVTREQFLKMLLEATDIEAEECENVFTDVADDWYKTYVLKAKNIGIVNGVTDTRFGIGENITRQDMAVMITRTIEKLGITIEETEVDAFADNNKVSDYATEAVEYMKSIGLIEGYNNEYRPLDNLTRAEAAKVISELLKLI